MSSTSINNNKIPSRSFYSQYHGHNVQYLKELLPHLRQSITINNDNDINDNNGNGNNGGGIIWMAGDSSLDNKYWFTDIVPAVPGPYSNILHPSQSKPDITYWINQLIYDENNNNNTNNNSRQQKRYVAINTAVEATTINERTYKLREQDIFIRDNINNNDILIVSIGGNDVALAPSPCTIISMLCLMCCIPTICIQYGETCSTVPIDDYCCGCTTSVCSCLCAFPPCLGYFRHLFGTRVQKYIERLTSKTKPAKILVCMIYYPDETPHRGWAGPALSILGYNTNPNKLQTFILKMYTHVLPKIHISGQTQIIPVPFYHVLDGKNTNDYIQRVEPSPSGGKKIAELLLNIIIRSNNSNINNNTTATTTTAIPTTHLMAR